MNFQELMDYTNARIQNEDAYYSTVENNERLGDGGLMSNTINGLMGGLGSVVGGVGSFSKALTGYGDTLQWAGDEMQAGRESSSDWTWEKMKESPGQYMMDPGGFMYGFSNLLGSQIPMLLASAVTGGAAGFAVNAGGKALGLGSKAITAGSRASKMASMVGLENGATGLQLASNIAKGASMGIGGGLVDAASEAGSTYDRALELGNDEGTARNMALQDFGDNILYSIVSNAVNINAYKRIGNIGNIARGAEEAVETGTKELSRGEKLYNSIADFGDKNFKTRFARNVLTANTVEAYEEGTQQDIQDNALNLAPRHYNPLDMSDDAKAQMAQTFVGMFPMSGLGAIGRSRPKAKEATDNTEQPVTTEPTADTTPVTTVEPAEKTNESADIPTVDVPTTETTTEQTPSAEETPLDAFSRMVDDNMNEKQASDINERQYMQIKDTDNKFDYKQAVANAILADFKNRAKYDPVHDDNVNMNAFEQDLTKHFKEELHSTNREVTPKDISLIVKSRREVANNTTKAKDLLSLSKQMDGTHILEPQMISNLSSTHPSKNVIAKATEILQPQIKAREESDAQARKSIAEAAAILKQQSEEDAIKEKEQKISDATQEILSSIQDTNSIPVREQNRSDTVQHIQNNYKAVLDKYGVTAASVASKIKPALIGHRGMSQYEDVKKYGLVTPENKVKYESGRTTMHEMDVMESKLNKAKSKIEADSKWGIDSTPRKKNKVVDSKGREITNADEQFATALTGRLSVNQKKAHSAVVSYLKRMYTYGNPDVESLLQHFKNENERNRAKQLIKSYFNMRNRGDMDSKKFDSILSSTKSVMGSMSKQTQGKKKDTKKHTNTTRETSVPWDEHGMTIEDSVKKGHEAGYKVEERKVTYNGNDELRPVVTDKNGKVVHIFPSKKEGRKYLGKYHVLTKPVAQKKETPKKETKKVVSKPEEKFQNINGAASNALSKSNTQQSDKMPKVTRWKNGKIANKLQLNASNKDYEKGYDSVEYIAYGSELEGSKGTIYGRKFKALIRVTKGMLFDPVKNRLLDIDKDRKRIIELLGSGYMHRGYEIERYYSYKQGNTIFLKVYGQDVFQVDDHNSKAKIPNDIWLALKKNQIGGSFKYELIDNGGNKNIYEMTPNRDNTVTLHYINVKAEKKKEEDRMEKERKRKDREAEKANKEKARKEREEAERDKAAEERLKNVDPSILNIFGINKEQKTENPKPEPKPEPTQEEKLAEEERKRKEKKEKMKTFEGWKDELKSDNPDELNIYNSIQLYTEKQYKTALDLFKGDVEVLGKLDGKTMAVIKSRLDKFNVKKEDLIKEIQKYLDLKVEGKTEAKVEAKTETKVEPKTEPKVEPKAETKADVKKDKEPEMKTYSVFAVHKTTKAVKRFDGQAKNKKEFANGIRKQGYTVAEGAILTKEQMDFLSANTKIEKQDIVTIKEFGDKIPELSEYEKAREKHPSKENSEFYGNIADHIVTKSKEEFDKDPNKDSLYVLKESDGKVMYIPKKTLHMFDVNTEKLKAELGVENKKQQEKENTTSDTLEQKPEPDEDMVDDLKRYRMHKNEGVNSVVLQSDNKEDITWDDVQRLMGEDNVIKIIKTGNKIVYIAKKDLEKLGLDINKLRGDYITNRLNVNDLNSKENKVSNDSLKGDGTHAENVETGSRNSGNNESVGEGTTVSNGESDRSDRGINETSGSQTGENPNRGRTTGNNDSVYTVQQSGRFDNRKNTWKNNGISETNDRTEVKKESGGSESKRVEQNINGLRKRIPQVLQKTREQNRRIGKAIRFLFKWDKKSPISDDVKLKRRIIDKSFGNSPYGLKEMLIKYLGKTDTVVAILEEKCKALGFNSVWYNLIGLSKDYIGHLNRQDGFTGTFLHEILHGIIQAIVRNRDHINGSKFDTKEILLKKVILANEQYINSRYKPDSMEKLSTYTDDNGGTLEEYENNIIKNISINNDKLSPEEEGLVYNIRDGRLALSHFIWRLGQDDKLMNIVIKNNNFYHELVVAKFMSDQHEALRNSVVKAIYKLEKLGLLKFENSKKRTYLINDYINKTIDELLFDLTSPDGMFDQKEVEYIYKNGIIDDILKEKENGSKLLVEMLDDVLNKSDVIDKYSQSVESRKRRNYILSEINEYNGINDTGVALDDKAYNVSYQKDTKASPEIQKAQEDLNKAKVEDTKTTTKRSGLFGLLSMVTKKKDKKEENKKDDEPKHVSRLGLFRQIFDDPRSILADHCKPALKIYDMAYEANRVLERKVVEYGKKFQETFSGMTSEESEKVHSLILEANAHHRDPIQVISLSDKYHIAAKFGDFIEAYEASVDADEKAVQLKQSKEYADVHKFYDTKSGKTIVVGVKDKNRIFEVKQKAEEYTNKNMNNAISEIVNSGDKKYTPEQMKSIIDHYLGYRKMMDSLYEEMVKMAKECQIEDIPAKLNGFFPHIHLPYVVSRKNESGAWERVTSFYSYTEASDMVSKMEKNGETAKLTEFSPLDKFRIGVNKNPDLLTDEDIQKIEDGKAMTGDEIYLEGAKYRKASRALQNYVKMVFAGKKDENGKRTISHTRLISKKDLIKRLSDKKEPINSELKGTNLLSIIKKATPKNEDGFSYDDLMHVIANANAKQKYNKHLLTQTDATGYSLNVPEAVYRYMIDTANYVSKAKFRRDSTQLYTTLTGLDFDKQPKTEVQKYLHEYIQAISGVRNLTAVDNFLDEFISTVPGVGPLINRYISRHPYTSFASKSIQFNNVLKLGMFNPSTALVQLFQLLNANAKLGGNKYLGMSKVFRYGMNQAFFHSKEADKKFAKLFDAIGINNQPFAIDTGLLGQKPGLMDKKMFNLFSLNEAMNKSMMFFNWGDTKARKASAIAAYTKARSELKMNEADAIKYARDFVTKTNFDYSVVNTPLGITKLGLTGKMLLQFSKYPLFSLGFIKHNTKEENIRFLVPLFIMGGLFGMPCADLWDEATEKVTGISPNMYIKSKMIEWAGNDSGKKALVNVSMYGAFSLAGVNISNRIGLNDAVGVHLGPTISTGKNLARDLFNGKPLPDKGIDILNDLSPRVGSIKASISGQYKDSKGQTVTEYDAWQRGMKALGFRTLAESKASDSAQIIKQCQDKLNECIKKAKRDYANDPSTENYEALKIYDISDRDIAKILLNKEATTIHKLGKNIPKRNDEESKQLRALYKAVEGFNS